MEEQGIMGLAPQAVGAAPPMPQGMPPEIREATPDEQMATADLMYQARKEMPKSQISKDIMDGAAQADPQEIAMFKQILSANPLPREIIDALLQMIQLIYENPGDYPAIRQELLAEGVPEELLPPTLDLGFFTSLEMALYEVPAAQMDMGIGAMAPPDLAPTAAPPMPPPQGFAQGGIASLKPIAQELQTMGRGGDTILAHINPGEARMLKRMGGAGTINPYTGLPEFIKFKGVVKAVTGAVKSVAKGIGGAIKSVGKAIGGALKSVGQAVKKFASSTVGRIVTTIALGFLVGPAAANLLGVTSVAGVAAVSGFVGSGGAALLGGAKLGDALKAGVTGAVVAGAGATVFGGADAWAAKSYTGPTTISGQWNRITDSVSKAFSGTSPADVTGANADPFASKVPTSPEGAMAQANQYASVNQNITGTTFDSPVVDTVGTPNIDGIPVTGSEVTSTSIPGGLEAESAAMFNERLASGAPFPGAEADAAAMFNERLASGVPFPGAEADAAAMFNERLASGAPFPGEAAPVSTPAPTSPMATTGGYETTADYQNLLRTSGAGPTQGGMIVPGESALPEGITLKGQVPTGAPAGSSPSFLEDPIGAAKDFYNKNISPSGIEKEGFKEYSNVYNQAKASAIQGGANAAQAHEMALAAAKESLPGVISKYGPMAAIGTAGVLSMLPGAPPEEPLPEDLPVTGVDLLAQNPQEYGVNLGEVSTSRTPVSYGQYGDLYTTYLQQLQEAYKSPTLAQVQAPTLQQMQSPMFTAAATAPAPAAFNMGGFVGNRQGGGIGAFGMGYKRGGMPTHYPRKVGAINGPGTGTSDSIPAMLSDGEFVFTAQAVRGMGNGSRKEGAKKMYAMMKALEGNA